MESPNLFLTRSAAAQQQRAEQAREDARRTYEAAHGGASKAREFSPSPELKRLFREAAKRIHPDLATDPVDQERLTRFMAEANLAYQEGDTEALQRLVNEFHDAFDVDLGEGIGAQLIRIVRQISGAKERISVIENELERLFRSEIAQLKQEAEEAQHHGRDLLNELATAVGEQIQSAKQDYEALLQAAKPL